MTTVDLNCDMGESFGAYHIGADAEVMPFITSANVACGFHGGDPGVMRETVALAKQHGVAVGAHPGLPDLVGFGRRTMDVSAAEVYDAVVYQIGALAGTAAAQGVRLQHVKAHGALYHMGAASREIAQAIARAVRDVDRGLVFFALPASHLVTEAEAAGLKVANEAFADRNYTPEGTLVSRKRADAHVGKTEDVGQRAIRMVRDGRVRAVDGKDIAIRADTICIHGDGPHAADFARQLRSAFERDAIGVRAMGRATTA